MKEDAGFILVVWLRRENYHTKLNRNLLLHPSMQHISNIRHSRTTVVKRSQCCQNGDHKKTCGKQPQWWKKLHGQENGVGTLAQQPIFWWCGGYTVQTLPSMLTGVGGRTYDNYDILKSIKATYLKLSLLNFRFFGRWTWRECSRYGRSGDFYFVDFPLKHLFRSFFAESQLNQWILRLTFFLFC